MRDLLFRAGLTALMAAGALGAVLAATDSPATLLTPWGDPDLQGIWTDETDTPLQRSLKFGTQEFFSDTERAELDRERSSMEGRDRRAERGTTADVAGAYNDVFTPKKRTGARTSRIADPANGRLPPQTPEAQKITAAERAFRLSLLAATATCKNNEPPCRGGTYDPKPSPRYAELAPRYNTATINRYAGPEDASLAVRCLMGGLPENGTLGAIADRISFRRIVQTLGGITMFYDVGQGQGWQRNIVMDGSPHLPAGIRQWYGDSRGRWEGDTLVIDVTNFSAKTDFQGSRENRHLVERWRRSGPATLDYQVTVEDPSVWATAWTARQEFTLQDNRENRIYSEPRCIEGNYGLPGLLQGHRTQEREFAQGKGPDPRTISTMADDGQTDPLE